jgi:ankyrin repeat protein
LTISRECPSSAAAPMAMLCNPSAVMPPKCEPEFEKLGEEEEVWDVIITGDAPRLAQLLAEREHVSSLINIIGGDRQTPLHVACDVSADGDECVTLLVSHGAELNAVDASLRTPLVVACEVGSLNSACLLMQQPSTSLRMADENGMLPVHWLALRGACELLILALKRGAEVDPINAASQTPLHVAISRGQLACALVLLDAGASPAALDKEQRNAMHLAMQHSGGMGACSESTLLLLRLLQLDASLVRTRDSDRRTPL